MTAVGGMFNKNNNKKAYIPKSNVRAVLNESTSVTASFLNEKKLIVFIYPEPFVG